MGNVKTYAFSFAIRSSWLRQLNTLERSVSGAPKILTLLNAFFHFSNNIKRHTYQNHIKMYFETTLVWCLEYILQERKTLVWKGFIHKFLTELVKCLLAYSFVLHLFFLLIQLCHNCKLRHGGNKEDLMELLILVLRKSPNT